MPSLWAKLRSLPPAATNVGSSFTLWCG
jgi:hypothetical protein